MIYLQFPDEATARTASGWWLKKSGWPAPTPELQIAVRGELYNDDGEYDNAGGVIKEPSTKDGFFIDVIYGDIPADARIFIVTPSHPDFVLA
ncbi:hypothetical protein RSW05_11710 [Escherichia coli]|uniref:hypothetical protein n=1 Tax=Escherichia coli TaxID=562 RepID=UPI000928C6C3|nr:hypothetical protein [Escherichia coli]MDT8929316.1 hypothetical protein [Escherichia coli]OJP22305.1 hypothetical protein BK336_01225 [Escherichia coli]HAZ7413386.1 hypothetical protein [Escherichia coli]HAZ7433017.1 hypothetical protein [Escherichia coli]HDP7078220.1 hypothetical protein [Escherichia coli]